jgi:hypothetical protein
MHPCRLSSKRSLVLILLRYAVNIQISGLLDDIFAYHKYQFGCYTYNCHLQYFMDVWYLYLHIIWPFGIACGNLVYSPRFWYNVPIKSGNHDIYICCRDMNTIILCRFTSFECRYIHSCIVVKQI